MKLSKERFVEWLEGGGFSLADYRRTANSMFSTCEQCVMARFAQLVTGDETVGVGRCNYAGKVTDPTPLPGWAERVVLAFDHNYMGWSQEQMVRELVEVVRA